jgi:hypothetical protein
LRAAGTSAFARIAANAARGMRYQQRRVISTVADMLMKPMRYRCCDGMPREENRQYLLF